MLGRWKKLIRGALASEGNSAFGDAARQIRRRFNCTQRWRQLVRALIKKDTKQEFGVAIKMMHVGFFKSFTIPATTYFIKYHDRKKMKKQEIIARWSRLTAKLFELHGIDNTAGAFVSKLTGKNKGGGRFEGGETDESYAARRTKPDRAAQ